MFPHFLFPLDVTVYGNFDFMTMFIEFGGYLYAQMAVTSIGCLDDVNLLYFRNYLIIVSLTRTTEGW